MISLSFDYDVGLIGSIKLAETGQVGDFIGVIGTFFALTGTLLLYLTFREHIKQKEKESFESSFFEMIRLQRDNVKEIKHTKYLPRIQNPPQLISF